MTTIEIESAIAILQRQIAPLQAKQTQLLRKLDQQKSTEFIAINCITRADVELSSGDDRPYFGNVVTFALWLRANSTKNWAEWNGRIYRTSDLIAGRIPDMPAYMDDLPR